MVIRLHQSLFPWMCLVSLAMHGGVAVWFGRATTELPRPLPIRVGKTSIEVSLSVPTQARPIPQPEKELVPHSTFEVSAPVKAPRPITLALPKPDELTFPVVMPRPALAVVKIAPLEPVPEMPKQPSPPVKKNLPVAKENAPASAPSQASQGVVDELPQEHPGNSSPPYPDEALQKGQEGTVMLLVQVDAQGNVSAIRVNVSSGYPLLDESALTTVRRWKFIPGRRDNRAIFYEVQKPIVFSIPRRNRVSP